MKNWVYYGNKLISETYFDRYLIIANLGDTRAVLLKGEKALRMTVDHKANSADEIKRILEGGGLIYNNRVAGALAVTRSVGDLDFKACVFLHIKINLGRNCQAIC